MKKVTNPKTKTWLEVFQSERKEFPQGCAVTRVVPNKKTKYTRKIKYKRRDW